MLIVGKPGMQNITVSFYVLDTARDFWGQDCRVVHSSGFVKHIFQYLNFIVLIERI